MFLAFKWLLANGADPHIPIKDQTSFRGYTPVHLLARYERQECYMSMLIECAVDVSLPLKFGMHKGLTCKSISAAKMANITQTPEVAIIKKDFGKKNS